LTQGRIIAVADLTDVARERLADAKVLLQAGRYEGGVYLCGYAVEIALKVRVCKSLQWKGFPESVGESRKYQSFLIHDLEMLLHLSGLEEKIRTDFRAEWQKVLTWNPERRYEPPGHATPKQLEEMIASSEVLLDNLL
jgi:hypothetical protein